MEICLRGLPKIIVIGSPELLCGVLFSIVISRFHRDSISEILSISPGQGVDHAAAGDVWIGPDSVLF